MTVEELSNALWEVPKLLSKNDIPTPSAKELYDKAYSYLSSLTQYEKDVFLSHVSSEIPIHDIANYYKKTDQAISSTLSRALHRLSREIWLREYNPDRGTSLISIGISGKTYAVLSRNGIKTIDQLCSYSRGELLAMRAVGKVTIYDIEARLDLIGRKLKQEDSTMSSTNKFESASQALAGDGMVEVTYDDLTVTFDRIDRKVDSKEKFDAWHNFMLACKDMLTEEGDWPDGIESQFDFASYGNLGSALLTLKSYARSLFNSAALDDVKHPKHYVSAEPWQKIQQYVAKSDSELYLTSSMVKDKFDAIMEMKNPRVRVENLLRLYDACHDMFGYCGIPVSGRHPIPHDGMSVEEVAEKLLTRLTTDSCFYDATAQYFTVSKSLWESICVGNANIKEVMRRMPNDSALASVTPDEVYGLLQTMPNNGSAKLFRDFWDGASYESLAERTGLNINEVRLLLFDVENMIRRMLLMVYGSSVRKVLAEEIVNNPGTYVRCYTGCTRDGIVSVMFKDELTGQMYNVIVIDNKTHVIPMFPGDVSMY